MKSFIIAMTCLLGLTQLKAQEISPYLAGTNWWYQIQDKPHIRDSIAPSHIRSLRIGGNGYNKSMPSNTRMKGWVQMARDMGMEPIVQVSAFVGNRAATAASMVEFFNVNSAANGVEPVKIWSIGNEPALDNDFTVQEVRDYVLEIAEAMKEVDPDILIFAPDMAWANRQYFDELINGSADITGAKLPDGTFLVDGMNWHIYPMKSAYNRSDVKNIVAGQYNDEVEYVTGRMSQADNAHGRTGDDQLKWSIGEFNINVAMSSYGDQYTTVEGLGTHSFINGQFFADLFGLSMEKSAYYTTSWSIQEASGRRDEGDLGMFDGNSVETHRPRSSFHHTSMVGEYIYGEYIKVNDNRGNNIKAYGGLHPDNSFSIMVLNQDEANPYNFALNFNGITPNGEYDLIMDANININKEFEGFIPAQSSMVFDFDASGNLIKKVFYSLAHAKETAPPTVLMGEENTVLVSASQSSDRPCVGTAYTVSSNLAATSDEYSISWDFGDDATPQTSTEVGEVSVTYSTEGSKTAIMKVFKNGVEEVALEKTLEIEVGSCQQAPYQGTPQTIPGIVLSVNYDEGGQDVAYWDQEEENLGPGIRQGEGVDTDNGDIEGNVGYIRENEWIEYTLEVEEAGTYDVQVNYASQDGGGAFRLFFDGLNKTGDIEVPATGNWGDYESLIIRGINLEAGITEMRFVVVSTGFNLGQMEFAEEGSILSANDEQYKNVKIYPNPVSQYVNISEPSLFKEYKIFASNGALVEEGKLQNTDSISVNNLDNGIYTLKLIGKQGEKIEKFIKK